jgi:PAP2 superfamily
MNKSTLLRIFLFVTSLQLLIVGCKKDDPTVVQAGSVENYDANVALGWYTIFAELERFTPGYRPPIAGRAAAYVGLAAYESVVKGMTGYKSLTPVYSGLTIPAIESGKEYHYPTVLNACYAQSMRLFFPTAPADKAALVKNTEDEYNNVFIKKLPLDVFNRSKAYGKAVADAVFAYSKTDTEGHERYANPTDKNYPNGTQPYEWRRTFPDFTDALLPNWGKCRPMAVAKTDMQIPAPLPYSEKATDEIYKQGKEVYDAVKKIKAGQYYEGKWIADFWSDDCAGVTVSPSGRWIVVMNQVVARQRPNLAVAVVGYTKMGFALCDAGISAWDQKFKWKVERPQTYIERVFKDKSWSTIMCPTSEGVGKTPPFPAYPSGHSVFGAAAAEVLTATYGANYAMYDRTHALRTDFIGTPRYFKNFYAMAEENAYSRIPIGVHFRMDCSEGLTLGYRVGKKVNALPFK